MGKNKTLKEEEPKREDFIKMLNECQSQPGNGWYSVDYSREREDDLRKEALRQACLSYEASEDVLSRATKYYEFLSGENTH